MTRLSFDSEVRSNLVLTDRSPSARASHHTAHRSVALAATLPASVMLRVVAGAVATSLLLLSATNLSAQSTLGQGGSITPYAGYLVTGQWYDGPVGTSLSTTNAPIVGAQLAIPLVSGLSLVGNVGYASGDVRVGVPIIGGVNIGTNNLWVYDAGLELGGMSKSRSGIAPFVQGGVGGLTNNMRNSLFSVNSTNLTYSAGVGVDVGFARNLALRVQAKDYIGRFDSQEAVGVSSRGNLSHNWALSAGLKLSF